MGTTAAALSASHRQGIRTRALIVLAMALLTKTHGRPPTLAELCTYTGKPSKGAMWMHLQQLVEYGIVCHEHGARGYTLVSNWRDLYDAVLRELGDDAGKY